jgi:hypothetical protein
MSRHAQIDAPASSSLLRALRVLALLTVLVLLTQGATAGLLFPPATPGSLEWHGVGAIGLHVVTGLTAIAAFLHWGTTGGSPVPPALAVAVFALTFLQAWLGQATTLWAHVPGALALMLAGTWVLAWAWRSD